MQVTQRLAARWYLVLLAGLIGALVGASTIVHLAHGSLREKRTIYFVGSSEILVDSDPSTLTDVAPASGQTNLAGRAPLIATYANQPSVRDAIARRVGIAPSQITLEVTTGGKTGSASNSPGKAAIGGRGADTIILHAGGASPTIEISTQATGLKKARALAGATIGAIEHALARLRAAQPATTATTTTSTTAIPPSKTSGSKVKRGKKLAAAKRAAATQANQQAKQVRTIVLRRLGGVNATEVVSRPKKSTAIVVAIATFVGLLIVILLLDNALAVRRRARAKPVERSATRPE